MNEIVMNGLEKTIYEEKLGNGLEIIYVPYEDKNNYIITYGVRFGSEITEFTPFKSSKSQKVPAGIAHFLEHKMFEQETGEDPFTFFSKTGTSANASTSYTNTKYFCYGTKNFEENLEYLINFVNSPYYTDENVEKEKGIIAEEIKMYADIPDWKLDAKLKECIYKIYPRRVDIAGKVSDIEKITKEDLYLCYKNFYVPNNMFIIISGNFNKDAASKIIHTKLDSKKSKTLPVVKNYKEIIEVNKKYLELESDVNVPKVGIGLKIYRKDLSIKEEYYLDLYLEMFKTILFGSSSEFREYARVNNLTSSFGTEWETADKFKTLLITSNTTNPDLFIEKIKSLLLNHEIREEDFNRIKKVWIASEVKIIDYIEATESNIYDDILSYHKIYNDRVDIIRNMSLETLNKLIKQIDFNNISVVKMISKKE